MSNLTMLKMTPILQKKVQKKVQKTMHQVTQKIQLLKNKKTIKEKKATLAQLKILKQKLQELMPILKMWRLLMKEGKLT
jgi:cell shape-determining protein MreC